MSRHVWAMTQSTAPRTVAITPPIYRLFEGRISGEWTRTWPIRCLFPCPRSPRRVVESEEYGHPDGHLIRRTAAAPGLLPDGFQLRAPKVKGSVAGDVLEVCIGAKQFCPDVETRLGDDAVHSSTHGHPPASQRTV